MESHNIGGNSNFNFSGARIESLGASEYTLVDIQVDTTGSTDGFENDLRNMLIAAVDACRKSPRSANLLIRTTQFSSYLNGVSEIHGFKPLADIDTAAYPVFHARGGTPLYDATYSSVGAVLEYAEKLLENDYPSNAICFVITDGDDTSSITTPKMIAQKVQEARKQEKLDSILTILIGVNAQQYKRELEAFHKEAEFDHLIFVDDVTPQKLAKLASFVSQSVSSQSQAMGTGGPSQNVSATI